MNHKIGKEKGEAAEYWTIASSGKWCIPLSKRLLILRIFFFFYAQFVIISKFCRTQEVWSLPFIKVSGGQISKGARQYERTFFPSTESLKLIANESLLNSIGAGLRAFLMMYICEASLGVWLHFHHSKLCNYSSSRFRH